MICPSADIDRRKEYLHPKIHTIIQALQYFKSRSVKVANRQIYIKENNMDIIKKIFPYSFNKKKDLSALLVNVIIQFLVGAVAGILIGVLIGVPIIGALVGAVCGLIELYVIVGIVLSVLDYLKILK